MWQPEPDWERLPGGHGTATAGLWRAELAGRAVVVKRLNAPLPGDPTELSDPQGPGWWRREADVALAGTVEATPGLHGPAALAVEEDAQGVTLVLPWVVAEPVSALHIARCLGRFAGADLGDPPWLVRDQLRARLDRVARRGGWRRLAGSGVAEVATRLWSAREAHLATSEALPRVAQHGDPVPGNLVAGEDEAALALDWSTLGRGPVGADLGYWSLSALEDFEPLLEAYLGGLPPGIADRAQVRSGARITAVYTLMTRLEWAMATSGAEEGASGLRSQRSPGPHLQILQRHLPHLEALLSTPLTDP